jgi:GDP-L-fucose synthase
MSNYELSGARCLVAGGAGFIGSHLVRRLTDAGASVRATFHVKPPKERIAGVQYVQADLRTAEPCAQAVAGMDYVFNSAANTQGAAVIREKPLAHVTPNVPLNAYLIDEAHKAGVKRFLFLSSGAAYPDTGHRPAEEREMFDGDPVDVYFAVAWMKRYAEILCRTYATKIRNPMSCVVVRPSNVYGPGDKFDFNVSHVTAALIRRVVERQNPFEVWGTGEDVRDLIYIDDFMDGLFAAFQAPDPWLEINICSGEGVTVRQILETAIAVDGFSEAKVVFDPTKPSTVPVRRLSNQLAKQKLGFEATTDLASGLAKALSWYRENPFKPEAPTAARQ